MWTRQLYWILTGPSFAVWCLIGVMKIIIINLMDKNRARNPPKENNPLKRMRQKNPRKCIEKVRISPVYLFRENEIFHQNLAKTLHFCKHPDFLPISCSPFIFYGRADGSTRVETNFSKVAFFEIFVIFCKVIRKFPALTLTWKIFPKKICGIK